jgi:hypothetical protein
MNKIEAQIYAKSTKKSDWKKLLISF